MRSDRDRLKDILAAIDRIMAKTSEGRAAFEKDEMLQVWVLYHLQVVGEAARALSSRFRTAYPDKMWSEAVGLRNILVHEYFELDNEEIWKVVELDLPDLRHRVEQVLRSTDETESAM